MLELVTRALVCRLGLALLALEAAAQAADDPSFERDVRPILAERCVSCHGPDKQKGGLRLDRPAGLRSGGDSGALFEGSGEGSLLLERIAADEPAERMPPRGEPLTAAQIGLVRAWIEAGAVLPKESEADATQTHWAFQPLHRPPLPEGTEPGCSPIDAFLADALARQGLTPSPLADRRTLIRRLYLNVLGLPPDRDKVAAFCADDRPAAYERLVDRVLASPRRGERLARHWLDVVRFAESHGFEMNQMRPNAWPYRDWVIAAFNHDEPFDRFIHEQLAGDKLDAGAATGFLVAGPWDQVKSPDPVLTAQQRADELHDIVSTTGSAFLGLTVGCARCHNHKFDPISQADYYALTALLAGVHHGDRPVPGPDAAERAARASELRRQLAPRLAALADFEPAARPREALLVVAPDDPTCTTRLVPLEGPAPLTPGGGQGEAGATGSTSFPATISHGYLYAKTPPCDVFTWNPGLTGRYAVSVSWGCGWNTHSRNAHYVLDRDGDLATLADQTVLATVDQQRFQDGTGTVPGKSLWSGFRSLGTVDLEPGSRLILRASDPAAYVSVDLAVFERVEAPAAPPAPPDPRRPVQAGANTDRFAPALARFVRLAIEQTALGDQPCIDELEIFSAGPDPHNVALASTGARVSVSGSLEGYPIHQVPHLNDGQYGNAHSWISDEPGRGWITIELAQPTIIDRVTWGRDRTLPPAFQDRLATRYQIDVSQNGTAWTEVSRSTDRVPYRGPSDPLQAADAFPTPRAPEAAAQLETLRQSVRTLSDALARALAVDLAYAGTFEQPAETRRMHRGDPTQPREPVAPGALGLFEPRLTLDPASSETTRRLALGQWMTTTARPLVARVIVNRLWQWHFGTGLVDTPSDFGHNGTAPSHPELLDWLACELVESGWSLRTIEHMIMCSHAYQQASQAREDLARVDAGDRLVGRYPPRRLEAEVVRDAILTASGVLDSRMGGPGFDLFEPNTNYVKVFTPRRTFGPPEFRRMIYQQKPRMQLDDTFGPFDCPDAGQIAPRRNRSITPQQALSLLNSPFVVDQAGRMARRIESECASESGRVAAAFLYALQRTPEPSEQQAAERLVSTHGLSALCRALLNANEFLFLE